MLSTSIKYFVFWFLLILCVAYSALAQSVDITLNDISLKSKQRDTYVLGKTDPFLILHYETATDTLDQVLDLKLTVSPLEDSDISPRAQLFWSQTDSGFSQKNSIRFPLAYGEQAFTLPLSLMDQKIKSLRLDFENCPCEVTLTPLPWVSSKKSIAAQIPRGLLIKQAALTGLDIPISEWVGQELKQIDPRTFINTGWDPRIINTSDLDLPLDKTAGVYFDFDFDIKDSIQKFELFWKLSNTKWSALRSAHIALDSTEANSSRKQIFIPFDRLHSNKILERLRFDFQPCNECRFQLNETRIVGSEEAAKYHEFIPKRLYVIHTERPPLRSTANAFVKKVSHDRGFNVFYALLIFFVLTFGSYHLLRNE